MAGRIRITLAQFNPTVGDIRGNADLAHDAWKRGKAAGADLVALTEMFVTGYNAQDLVRKPAFRDEAIEAVADLARRCADGPALAVGGPWFEDGRLYNACHLCRGGEVAGRSLKRELPNEAVFDEKRVFAPAPPGGPFAVAGARIGFPICEDAWHAAVPGALAAAGAELLLVPNGSPYRRGKSDRRIALMRERVAETGLPLVYLNMVGGQDDQAFDGASFGLNPGGELAFRLPPFEEEVAHVDLERGPDGLRIAPGGIAPQPDAWEQDYRAMVETVRDYLRKSGFGRAVLGLSGGVDSALAAAIAADAIGPANVRCVMLPSEYTSPDSTRDAAAVAGALGCRLDTVPISGPREAVTRALAGLFEGTEPDATEENVQSRLRGLLLMALSNKFGEMLLTTGNKSEVAVGYATIYGDMAGGYNPLKDLYKTRVFETCRWRNANHRDWMRGPPGEVISPRVIDKPPTAELRENQRDDDSLPPYDVLDPILEGLVDNEESVEELAARGLDAEAARAVERLVQASEYKRFQSAPGTRLTGRAFWLDRRYPVVNRWRAAG